MPKTRPINSVALLIGIAIVVVSLAWLYRNLAVENVRLHETRANTALTRALANALRANYAGFVRDSVDLDPESLAQRTEITGLREAIANVVRETPLVGIEIFNARGTTLYSTDPELIGTNRLADPDVRQALGGARPDEITETAGPRHGGFVAERELLTVYVPVSYDPNGPTAIFAVSSDVTELLARVDTTQRLLVVALVAAFALLFGLLLLSRKRAERLLQAQQSRRRRQRMRNQQRAYHDPLTGLPNRASFQERVTEAIKRTRRTHNLLAVMFIDLDRFKRIIDSLGHDVGDKFLKLSARRIQSCLRDSDMVFRMGGDEYAVIAEGLDQNHDVTRIAERIVEAMAESFTIQGHEIIITASIGIAVCDDPSMTREQLIKGADAAMYEAKNAGRNCFRFYTHDMSEEALDRLSLETALQQALNRNEFHLLYQPKIATDSGAIVGVEALLRWNNPRRGTLTPDTFLPYLEDSGLIVPVGEWILMTACRQAREWQRAGLPPLRVSVNLSAKQFRQRALVDSVALALQKTGLAPAFLELELTESVLMENKDSAAATIEELKALGVSLSIDDFGTGYSSLNYLKRFSVDYLKIDQTFIKNIPRNSKDTAIIHAIVSLAQSLEIDLVAEGVEENTQYEYLKALGCHEVQGFLISRPVDSEEIVRMLSTDLAPTLSTLAVDARG